MVRKVVVVLAFVLAASIAVSAQSLYYQAYDRGLTAYKAGNLALARQMFERAIELDARQARRKNMGGTFFGEYLPEYYLGLICVQQKRYPEALVYFDSLLKAGLISAKDKEYATLTSQRAVAEAALKPVVVAKAEPEPARIPPTDKPAPGPTAGPTPAPPPDPAPGGTGKEPPKPGPTDAPKPGPTDTPNPNGSGTVTTKTASSDIDRLSGEVVRSLNSGDFVRAWESVQRLGALPGGAESARGLATRVRGSIASAGEQRVKESDLPGARRMNELLARIAPSSTEAQNLQRLLDRRLATARLERDALTNLLRGDYQKVVALTPPEVATAQASARLMFFAACGRAALSLTAGADARDSLTSEARRMSDLAGKLGGSFGREERYISPEILAVLRRR